jgi:hypothetical protein
MCSTLSSSEHLAQYLVVQRHALGPGGNGVPPPLQRWLCTPREYLVTPGS